MVGEEKEMGKKIRIRNYYIPKKKIKKSVWYIANHWLIFITYKKKNRRKFIRMTKQQDNSIINLSVFKSNK